MHNAIPDYEEREQEIEHVFKETVTEYLENLKKKTCIQAQEAQRALNKWNSNRPTPKHIIMRRTEVKDKERILTAQEMTVSCQATDKAIS